MSQVQRGRLLAAAAEVVSEAGYGGMSMARVTSRAGVSRGTFYELFESREDCFLALFEEALARIAAVAVPAYEQEHGWRDGVRAGLSRALQFIGDEPGLGALLIVHALGAGPKVLERRARGLDRLIAIVDHGRSDGKAGHGPPRLTAEGIVGAVLSVLHARLLEPGRRPPSELLNELMAMIVLPYLGQAAASRELARPTPAAHPALDRPMAAPFEGLDLRITYRTLRALAVIAEHPGASNREIAIHAEIADQGQVSKLLTRLQKHGLLDNAGPGHLKGKPNAWTLTRKGEDLHRAVETGAGG
jgi:AcrR family transcriptional regulator